MCKDCKLNSTTHLLQVEDVIVEVILQLLVCIVDTELLKAVGLKVLKPENVQDTDGQTLEKRQSEEKEGERTAITNK